MAKFGNYANAALEQQESDAFVKKSDKSNIVNKESGGNNPGCFRP